MVRQNHMGAVGNKKMPVDLHSGLAQGASLFEKGDRIEDHPIANHAAAAGPQHAAGNQLKDELLTVDDDGVSGIVSASVARHNREVLRQNVDDLPFALVAPLGAHDHRSLTFFHFQLRKETFKQADIRAAPGVAHSLPARTSATNCWDKSREDVYELSYRVPMANSNAKGAPRAHWSLQFEGTIRIWGSLQQCPQMGRGRATLPGAVQRLKPACVVCFYGMPESMP